MHLKKNECIHTLFLDAVATTPHLPAVKYYKQVVSYFEINQFSNYVASVLTSNGVKPGDRIGISLQRHVGMIAVLLGILKCGATYVPLDPSLPRERLLFMINDAQLKKIITQNSILSRIPEPHKQNILLIEPDTDYKKSVTEFNPPTVSSDSIAYIMYTSGSTGKPKGVKVPHKSVVNFLHSMKSRPGIEKSDSVLAITTISFDISVLEIFLPLVSSACAIVLDHDSIRDGTKLVSAINQYSPDIIQGTPSFWRLLLASGWTGQPNVKALCGGESLSPDLVKIMYPKVGQLWNMYGPTETTVWSTCYHIINPEEKIFIGYPIANTSVYVLDTHLQQVAVGNPGELYIGGDGLSDGYHNNPDLTKEKFIRNPFATGLLYRTGDLAQFHPNGALEYIGRIDNQVKIRGFRIELTEIEHVLLDNENILQCAVITNEYGPDDIRIVLFYTLKFDCNQTEEQIRSYLKKYLPEYMLPQQLIRIDSLPMTHSGKVDRTALKKRIVNNSEKSMAISTKTDAELYLYTLWEKLLKTSSIGITDNFFELGGTSLLAAKAITRIRNDTGIEISFNTLVLETFGQIVSKLSFSKIKQRHTFTNTILKLIRKP